jgi:hypothetical protein
MRSRSLLRSACAAIAVALVATGPLAADPAKLAAGDPFPTVDAESVTGTHVALPVDTHGESFVVVFGFSQRAGEAAARWSHALYAALPPAVAVYAVADLSRVPGLFRGFAVSGIRREASPATPQHRDHVLLLLRANDWSKIVPSGSDDDAVIVAVDRTGAVADIERRAYSDVAANEVAKTVTNRI